LLFVKKHDEELPFARALGNLEFVSSSMPPFFSIYYKMKHARAAPQQRRSNSSNYEKLSNAALEGGSSRTTTASSSLSSSSSDDAVAVVSSNSAGAAAVHQQKASVLGVSKAVVQSPPQLQQPQQEPSFVLLQSAPPPWHAVAFVGLILAVLAPTLPHCCSAAAPQNTLENNRDSDSSLYNQQQQALLLLQQIFARRLFPQYISVRQLAWIRLAMALTVWATTLATAMGPGWMQQTAYLASTKLKRGVPNRLKGFKTLLPFTSWSWNLLGLALTLSSYIAFRVDNNENENASSTAVVVHPVLLRLALVTWEVAAPCTLLVAAVVRYAIWPGILRLPPPPGKHVRDNTAELRSLRNKMMHNANVLLALTESCLLSGLPVRWSDAALAPLWGVLYVLFSWSMTHRWNDPVQHGPQFIYWFFDTTLPGYAVTKALAALLLALMAFYGIFGAVTGLLLRYDDGGGDHDGHANLAVHVLFVAAVSSTVMRFRD